MATDCSATRCPWPGFNHLDPSYILQSVSVRARARRGPPKRTHRVRLPTDHRSHHSNVLEIKLHAQPPAALPFARGRVRRASALAPCPPTMICCRQQDAPSRRRLRRSHSGENEDAADAQRALTSPQAERSPPALRRQSKQQAPPAGILRLNPVKAVQQLATRLQKFSGCEWGGGGSVFLVTFLSQHGSTAF